MAPASTQAKRPDAPREECPVCGGRDGILPEGSTDWAVCDAHRLKWRVRSRQGAKQLKQSSCPRLGWYLAVEPDGPGVHPPALPVLVGLALDTVLQYLWYAEELDFEAQIPAVEGHIFADLCLLRWWRLGLLHERLGREGGDDA